MDFDVNLTADNPWLCETVMDFNFFCCPECHYKTKTAAVFIEHALKFHERAIPVFQRHENPSDQPAIQDFNKDSYQCDKCTTSEEVFTSLSLLAKHVNLVHNKNGLHKCIACEKSYSTYSHMRQHIEQQHQNITHPCPKCNKRYKRDSLYNHYKDCGKNEVKKFQCDNCDFVSHSKRYLTAHVYKCHTKEKHHFKCDQCDKVFPFKYLLKSHEHDHARSPNAYVCENCGKSYGSHQKSSFKDHSKHCNRENESIVKSRKRKMDLKPTSENMMKCDLCDDVFTKKSYLTMHRKKVHPDVQSELDIYLGGGGKSKTLPKTKQYSCSHCDRTFALWVSYKEHLMKQHEKHTPFKCDSCDQSFGTIGRMKTHKRNVHSKKPCDICGGNRDYNSFAMQKHMAKYHGIYPLNIFKCNHCSKFYTNLKLRDKHMADKHADDLVVEALCDI